MLWVSSMKHPQFPLKLDKALGVICLLALSLWEKLPIKTSSETARIGNVQLERKKVAQILKKPGLDA